MARAGDVAMAMAEANTIILIMIFLRFLQLSTPLVTVQERRRKGQRSLTNIIRIVSREWSDWLRKGPCRPAMEVGSKCTAIKKLSTTDTSLFPKGEAARPPPWGIPDGVYSCEEVI